MLCNKIAVIPAYEPEMILSDLALKLSEAGFNIIIVDDGSGEKFADIFKKSEQYAKVLTHKQNLGKGCALKTAFSYISENFKDDYIVVTMDCDGQHKVSDAIKLCEEAEKNQNSLILGSRKLNGKIPLRSRFGNTCTRFAYWLSTGVKVYDTQTGLRAFNKCLMSQLIEMPGDRYEYEINMLLILARKKISMIEVPIETIYINNNSGSHFNTLRDSCRIYQEILKFSLSSIVSFFIDYGMYSLLILLTHSFSSIVSLGIANVGARVISASVNYTINRKIVFKSNANVLQTAIQYTILAILILCGNTALIELLVNSFGINPFLSKLITELVFFIISWTAQHFIIFNKKQTIVNRTWNEG